MPKNKYSIKKYTIILELLVSHLFVVFAVIYTYLCTEKNDPARYFCYIWILQIVIGEIFLSKYYYFTGIAFIYISSVCIVLTSSSFVTRLLLPNIAASKLNYEIREKRAITIIYMLTAIASLNPILAMLSNGFSIMNFFSLSTLLELNNSMAKLGYSGDMVSSKFTQVLLILVYLSPLYGGYIYAIINQENRKKCFIVFLPSFLILISQSTKSAIIASIFLWISGYFTAIVFFNKEGVSFNIRVFIKYLSLITLFLALLFVSMIFRIGEVNESVLDIVNISFLNYSFGHIPTIDIWIANNLDLPSYTYGIKTYYGISNLLGLANREQGIFQDFTVYATYASKELSTNVYTLFRCVIEDFGIYLSLVFFYIIGSLSYISFICTKKKLYPFFFQTILASFFFFYLYSFITSAWAYTSYMAAFILLYIMLKISFKTIRTS